MSLIARVLSRSLLATRRLPARLLLRGGLLHVHAALEGTGCGSRLVETSGSLSLSQEIIGPDGTTTVCGLTYLDELDCQLPVSGTYTLLVKAWTGTGTYNVLLQRLNNPVGCLSLGFGNPPTSASIDAAAEVDCYTFTGTAGDRMRSRAIETSGSLSLMQEIIRPDGATFSCGPTYLDELDCQLPVSGTYTLLVKDGTGTHTGTYNVILLRLNKPVGCLSLALATRRPLARLLPPPKWTATRSLARRGSDAVPGD